MLLGFIVVPTALLFGYSLFEWVSPRRSGAVTPDQLPRAARVAHHLEGGRDHALDRGPDHHLLGRRRLRHRLLHRLRHGPRPAAALRARWSRPSWPATSCASSPGAPCWARRASSTAASRRPASSTQPLDFILFSRTAVILGRGRRCSCRSRRSPSTRPWRASRRTSARRPVTWAPAASRRCGGSRSRCPGPAILATSALIFFLAAGDYVTPVLRRRVDTVDRGTAHRGLASAPTADYGKGAALSLLVLVGFVLIYLLLRFVDAPRGPAAGRRRRPERMRAGRSRIPWLAIVTRGCSWSSCTRRWRSRSLYAFNCGAILTWPLPGLLAALVRQALRRPALPDRAS